jgi:hypothetical protein
MSSDLVKCPHCFGDKPATAKVCLHCGRDEQGFGPMVPISQTVAPAENLTIKRRSITSDLNIHLLAGILATALGLLMMLSSGLGSLLFILGVALLLTLRVRSWRRQRQ